MTIDDPEESQESKQWCIFLRDIDIDSTSTICSGVWNCFDSVICLVFHFISDILLHSSNYIIYVTFIEQKGECIIRHFGRPCDEFAERVWPIKISDGARVTLFNKLDDDILYILVSKILYDVTSSSSTPSLGIMSYCTTVDNRKDVKAWCKFICAYLPKTVYNPVINNSTAIDIYMSHPKAICMNREPAKILT